MYDRGLCFIWVIFFPCFGNISPLIWAFLHNLIALQKMSLVGNQIVFKSFFHKTKMCLFILLKKSIVNNIPSYQSKASFLPFSFSMALESYYMSPFSLCQRYWYCYIRCQTLFVALTCRVLTLVMVLVWTKRTILSSMQFTQEICTLIIAVIVLISGYSQYLWTGTLQLKLSKSDTKII